MRKFENRVKLKRHDAGVMGMVRIRVKCGWTLSTSAPVTVTLTGDRDLLGINYYSAHTSIQRGCFPETRTNGLIKLILINN